MAKFYTLFDVANDYSLMPVDGKYQFGDLTHAKKEAQRVTDKWWDEMNRKGKSHFPLSNYKIKWRRTSAAGIRPESTMEWNGFIHGDELVYKIIERKKNPAHEKGFIIEDKRKRTCAEMHRQIKGFMEYGRPGQVYECGKCHKQFTVPKMKRKKNAETETRELSLYADNLGPSSTGLEKEVYAIREKFGASLRKGRPKKELQNLTKHAAHRAARAYSKEYGSGASAWQEIFTDKDLNDTAKYLYDSFYEEYSYTGNPRKRKMAKKKRSKKQLANDKRLGRMAKARAKKKRGGRRKKVARKKTTRRVVRRNPNRKVAKRTSRKKSHLWFAFVCDGKKVHYAYISDSRSANVGITPQRGAAAIFQTKSRATNVANILSRLWKTKQAGVANIETSAAKIKAACNAGK